MTLLFTLTLPSPLKGEEVDVDNRPASLQSFGGDVKLKNDSDDTEHIDLLQIM